MDKNLATINLVKVLAIYCVLNLNFLDHVKVAVSDRTEIIPRTRNEGRRVAYQVQYGS